MIIALSSSGSLDREMHSSRLMILRMYRSHSDWFIVCMPNLVWPICICE
jgi:hypothetical protein